VGRGVEPEDVETACLGAVGPDALRSGQPPHPLICVIRYPRLSLPE